MLPSPASGLAASSLTALLLPAGLLAAPPAGPSRDARPCFALQDGVSEPLGPFLPRRDGDHAEWGTYPDGRAWASTRARVELPLAIVLAKLRDHRNLKDMSRTRLVTRPQVRAGYLDAREVDVEVTLRALFVKLRVAWTEEWGYRVLAGSATEPEAALAVYQKVAGSSHLAHQCGSYLLTPAGPRATDLTLYEEVKARRRSAEDTRDMQRGILRNLREDRWPLPSDALAAPGQPEARRLP